MLLPIFIFRLLDSHNQSPLLLLHSKASMAMESSTSTSPSSSSSIQSSQYPSPWLHHLNWKMKWPWKRKGMESELDKRHENDKKRRLQALCRSLKAHSVEDLEDVLGAMALSECVYKPHAELLERVNQFKADFGGELMRIETVQISLSHAPHRYILAQSDSTLFASFIGTKQYRDFVADANVLQEAIFSDNEEENTAIEGGTPVPSPVTDMSTSPSPSPSSIGGRPVKPRKLQRAPRPAAHRGFLTRARGIPVLELYRLAQSRDRRLVLCGHSLGGAVAVLCTLTILRALSTISGKGDQKKGPEVKCITFSQPPVGNAALKEHVIKNNWQHHFRTYCIPEDIVPRILSPAYFQHYRMQAAAAALALGESTLFPKEPLGGPVSEINSFSGKLITESGKLISESGKLINESEEQGKGKNVELKGQLPTGLERSLWRIPKIAPLGDMSQSIRWFRRPGVEEEQKQKKPAEMLTLYERESGEKDLELRMGESIVAQESREGNVEMGSMVVLETGNSVGIKTGNGEEALVLASGRNRQAEVEYGSGNGNGNGNGDGTETNGNGVVLLEEKREKGRPWQTRFLTVPAYVPFGQLYILGMNSAEPLSSSEFTKLTTVRGMLSEVRDRFASHSMRSYRARFQNIYGHCMTEGIPFPAAVLEQLPHFHDWMARQTMKAIHVAPVAPPPVIHTATSVVPIGWTGVPGEGNSGPLYVDVCGEGLPQCTMARACINGRWFPAVVEKPSVNPLEELEISKENPLQCIRFRIFPPKKRPQPPPNTSIGPPPPPPPPTPLPLPPPSQNSQNQVRGGKESWWKNRPWRARGFSGTVSNSGFGGLMGSNTMGSFGDEVVGEVTIECSTDFDSTTKDVAMRIRRVRLIGLEGAGKTSLYCALLGEEGEERSVTGIRHGGVVPDGEWREGVSSGVGYMDGAGVSLQHLDAEVDQLRQELSPSSGPLGRRVDLVVLVHNLAHKIPRERKSQYRNSGTINTTNRLASLSLHSPFIIFQNSFLHALPFASMSRQASESPLLSDSALGKQQFQPSFSTNKTLENPSSEKPNQSRSPNGISKNASKNTLNSASNNTSKNSLNNNAPPPTPPPILSPLLREVEAAGIPVVLALTNKFAASADRRHLAAAMAMEIYGISADRTVIVNSQPYSIYGSGTLTTEEIMKAVELARAAELVGETDKGQRTNMPRLMQMPLEFMQRSFKRREAVLPVEGVKELQTLIHKTLKGKEEIALEGVTKAALKRELAIKASKSFTKKRQKNSNTDSELQDMTKTAAVGALIGSSLGIAVTIFVAVAKKLKP